MYNQDVFKHQASELFYSGQCWGELEFFSAALVSITPYCLMCLCTLMTLKTFGFVDKSLVLFVDLGPLWYLIASLVSILVRYSFLLFCFLFGRTEVFYLWSVWKIFQPEKTTKEPLPSSYRYNKVRENLDWWGRNANTNCFWISRFML